MAMAELKAREGNKSNLFKLYPDEGPYRRELYDKHTDFFRAGAVHQDRMFLAANRIGKTLAVGYEDSVHMTGLYPPWWEGKVFDGPIKLWVASDTAKDTRDILQVMLFGEKEELGTGLIPESTIIRTTPKHGIADAFDLVYIRHVSGGVSVVQHKSFDQGVKAFKGRAIHVAHLDEEPPRDVFTECTVRTMTTHGHVLLSLMPLAGRTDLVDDFIRTCANRESLPIQ